MTELRLYEKYKTEVLPELKKELGAGNVMELPSIKKVVINSGVGNFADSKEALALFEEELTLIAGQKPSERKARLSVASFKIKQGDLVGYAITLRGAKMWAFLDKLISLVLPRVRDFSGLNPNSFDRDGNYTVGIEEHTIFPEVNPNTTKGIRGMQVTVVTNSGDVDKSRKLLSLIGLPFRESSETRENR